MKPKSAHEPEAKVLSAAEVWDDAQQIAQVLRRDLKMKTVADELGKQLHDRATRGQALSSEEQGELAAWYAAQDRAETAALGLSLPKTTAALQAQIDVVLVQVAAATRRIQELTEENKALRGEITLTRRQLVQQATLQPA